MAWCTVCDDNTNIPTPVFTSICLKRGLLGRLAPCSRVAISQVRISFRLWQLAEHLRLPRGPTDFPHRDADVVQCRCEVLDIPFVFQPMVNINRQFSSCYDIYLSPFLQYAPRSESYPRHRVAYVFRALPGKSGRKASTASISSMLFVRRCHYSLLASAAT